MIMEENKTINFLKGLGECLLILVLFEFLPKVISPFFAPMVKNGGFWMQNLGYLLFEITLTAIFCIIYRETLKKDWKDFKENRKAYLKKAIPLWIYGLMIMFISNYIINMFITNGNIAANEEANRTIMTSLPIYAITSMIFFGPIMEELVFRKGMRNVFQKALPYAILSGLVFGGFHVATGIDSFAAIWTNWKELLYLIPYGALGFFFAIAYDKTNNIYTSITLHIMHNTLSVGMVLLSMLLGALV